MLRAEPYDERADIYSFGVVCWELLTAPNALGRLTPHASRRRRRAYSERRLVLPPDWNKRREELVLASSQRHLPLTQADELAFDAIASLFGLLQKTSTRPKSLGEYRARVGRASEDVETLVASVVILETSSSYLREHHPILMMMMVCSFRFIRRAALLALLGKKVVERQSSRSSICKKRTFRINNTLNIWTKKGPFWFNFVRARQNRRQYYSSRFRVFSFVFGGAFRRFWRSRVREREREGDRDRASSSRLHTHHRHRRRAKGFTTKEKI